MARAFTEEEKVRIKEQMMETALELFHDKGTKSLSIAELTKRVGIAQGSFYNFWDDKESLIVDLAAYRSVQKLKTIEKKFSASLADPRGFLSEVIYQYSLDLVRKIQAQPVYRDAFRVLKTNKKEVSGIEKLYGDFLSRLTRYWEKHKAVRRVDAQGLAHAFTGSFVLCAEREHFDEAYFDEVLKIYISGIVTKYVEV